MDTNFHLEIVTPDGKAFEGNVEELLALGALGEFGILPGHTPFLTSLESGPLAVRVSGKLEYYAVHGGFCEVEDHRVTVLTDYIEKASDIDQARAEAARHRAEDRLKNIAFTETDYGDTLAALSRARARLTAVERHAGK